jgi:hypothetical protein
MTCYVVLFGTSFDAAMQPAGADETAATLTPTPTPIHFRPPTFPSTDFDIPMPVTVK